MFRRKSEPPRPPTVIGPTGTFEGTIRADEDLLIEGRFIGTIESKGTITVGPQGEIHGDVSGGSVIVAGRIEGTVSAIDRLHMKAGGRIKGDARYGTMQVDQGGIIDGRTTKIDDVPELSLQSAEVVAEAPPPAKKSTIPPQLTATMVGTGIPPIKAPPPKPVTPAIPPLDPEPSKA